MTTDAQQDRLFLRRLCVDNYKCMSDFAMSFGDLTLLLGKNGCGKSSVFEVIHKLHQIMCWPAQHTVDHVFPASSLDRRSDANHLQTIGLQISDTRKESVFDYQLVIEHSRPEKKVRVSHETLSLNKKPLFSSSGGEAQLYRDNHSEGPSYLVDWSTSGLRPIAERHDNKQLVRFRKWVRNITALSLNPFNMKSGSDSDNVEYLDSDGGNFASWHRNMLLQETRRIVQADEKLKDILSGYVGLKSSETKGGGYRELLAEFNFAGGVSYKFDELSSGQRILIALYILIYGGDSDRLLLLDEPDNFVMLPEIQPLLSEIECEAGEELPQIALISHHPEAIDFISSEDSVWLALNDKGSVVIPEFENKTMLSTSELYARGGTP